MRFGVLGETAVWSDAGQPVRVPELKVRALLASLLVDPGRPVAVHRLIDDLWGDEPPGNPTRALQAKVSQLRRVLEEAEPGGRGLVVSRPPGYQLVVAEDALDAHRFAGLVVRARTEQDPRVRARLLADALGLWRGPAFADFADEAFTRAAANRLEEDRLAVLEDHAEARLDSGEHVELVGELTELVERYPLRERLRSVQLRALYRSGRQSEALAGYDELRSRLANELGLDPSPELAGLQRAMLMQDPELGGGAARQKPAPVRTRTNIVATFSDLIGREGAVADLRGLLAARRLVTVTGPGGVGKTRIAVAVGQQVRGTFPDGEWLVELAGSTGELAEVVAAALELRDDGNWGVRPEGERPLDGADRLAEVLRDKRMLLILDNCEHVVDEAAELVELLLRSAPGLTVLTTSQEPLALAGETLWPVPPLAPRDAVELFAARAAAAAPGFALDASNADSVAAICRRLDGIPLALELAATRVRALGVHRLQERLDDRFRLLDVGQRGVPARQRTLRAIIDWSWEPLTEPERAVLRRLAVHSEGCTLEAAEYVCAGVGADAGDVLSLLVRLVDRSLVVAVDGAEGPRYRLLESVSAYCVERMREAGEWEPVRRRHLEYYTRLAETAEPGLRGPGQGAWLTRLDAESGNLRWALEGAVERHETGHALRLVDALSWYWVLRGRLGEAWRSVTAALALPGGDAALRAKAGVWQTGLAVLTGDGTDRAARIEAALTACEQLADPVVKAWAQWFLAHALSGTGDLLEGEALTKASLDGFRAMGERWGEAAALADRSVQRLLRGDLTGAAADAERSVALFGEVGDACGPLWSVYPLASVAEIHGDYERAARLRQDGLNTAEEFGLSTQAADLLSGLGRTALLMGDFGAAREYHERSRRFAVELGFRAGEINAELGLGLGARREGLLDEAEARMRTVLDWHRQVGLDAANALILAELGFVAELRGDARCALALHEEGYETAVTTGDPRAVALALEGLAATHALAGDPEAAALLLGSASAARAATGAPLPAAERLDVDRATAAATVALGAARFADVFAQGESLPPEAAHARTRASRLPAGR
ncbi:BTAD domain-containing putative transcriptional regulator [Streptomyces lancefieldiae]|uniref:BTAD domain-containing putative transcriptional regulator n=1 Tax=Streptomyces lancefieldiae TaxID=3075520 RepID=A0ABU3AM77_9ACTN|nr:BTAD domain-containing putative transcriptional regulator [Streptomyces sp. DSM 40712]MDT0611058.1 BTAD domain-containing putative transcriptional regulator [Streptomyces sp. DSM 40712]